MSAGIQGRRMRVSRTALAVLAGALLAGATVLRLSLFEGPDQSVEPTDSPPLEAASGGPDAIGLPQGPVTIPEGCLPALESSGQERREVAGVDRHLIEGIVRDARTGQPVPVYEVYASPDAAVEPRLLPETQAPHHVRNLEGRFEVSTTRSGAHLLLIRSETHEDLVQRVAVPLVAPLELLLERGTWITGIVRDHLGRAKPHVTVWLQTRDGSRDRMGRDVTRTRSDDEGRFAFYRLSPGTYRLVAGPLTAPLDARDDLRIWTGQHLEVPLALPRLTDVLLRVQGESGQPVADARVTLLDEAGRVVRTAITGADGGARLPSVQEGAHSLQIQATGLVSLEEEIYVSVKEACMEIRRSLRR